MDYRFSPQTALRTTDYNKSSKLSFKDNCKAAIITPTKTIVINNNSNDTFTKNKTSERLPKNNGLEVSGNSFKNAWQNLLEVFPLIDPVYSYKILRGKDIGKKTS